MAADKQYQPIKCDIHDRFELACMREIEDIVTWTEIDQKRSEKLRFLDLEYTKEGEFLIAENQSKDRLKIRLDTITSTLPD